MADVLRNQQPDVALQRSHYIGGRRVAEGSTTGAGVVVGSGHVWRRGRRIVLFAGAVAAGIAILGGGSPASARQEDSVSVVAGPRYTAGGLKRWLFGSRYRDLWTQPIRVPVLRPDTFAGGLTLLERGGSKETLSLRFRGVDGREYVFRSVDKEQYESLPEDLQGTLAATIVQDMVSAKHPGAALVVAPLVRAAGVLHATPRLAVMADHPILGEHREDFAGILGTIEERPDEPETPDDPVARDSTSQRDRVGNGADPPRARRPSPPPGAVGNGAPSPANGANGGATDHRSAPYPLGSGDPRGGSPFDTFPRITGEERLDERLEGSSEDRVDSRTYLTARLIDMLVGDWDRHTDQWRWAQDRRGGTRYWLAIPRDRDNAFSHVGGVIGMIVPAVQPNALAYRSRYTSLNNLMRSARVLDEPILAELPRAVWDSIAHALRTRITDAVIDTAVAAMPAEWIALDGAALAARLRARRDALPEVARDAYALLAREVHVAGTEQADRADIEQRVDGTIRVRVSATDRDDAVYFDRVFVPSETREVRVHLGGGSDRAIVRGSGGAIVVRMVGGDGDDVLEDASDPARGSRVAFYDDSGDNHFVVGPDTRVDRRAYEPPSDTALGDPNPPPPRDSGAKSTLFAPRLDWLSIIGPVVGGGPSWTRYGFRRFPYASRFRVAALYAPSHNRFGVDADARFIHAGGRGETRLAARVTGLSVTRFYGFGNETPGDIDSRLVRVWATEYAITAEWIEEPARGVSIGVGPVLSHLDPTAAPGSPAELEDAFGTQAFTVGGLAARLTIDRRDSPTYPRKGAWLRADAEGFPIVGGDAPEPFIDVEARARAYLPLPGGLEPTIALRAGVDTGWGDPPLQYLAFLGGSSTLRGYSSQRFAGNTALYGGSEFRARLGHANLLIIKGDIGSTLLVDVGRVFVSGQRSRKWHAGYGGGLWFSGLDGAATAHLVYAYGEKSVVYLGLGLPF